METIDILREKQYLFINKYVPKLEKEIDYLLSIQNTIMNWKNETNVGNEVFIKIKKINERLDNLRYETKKIDYEIDKAIKKLKQKEELRGINTNGAE